MSKRIIYYYQTLNGLDDILNKNTSVTHIHLASIHFGLDQNNKPYIHLNNNNPYDSCFDSVWEQLNEAKNLGIKIVLMIGGAGGAYNTLFYNFDVYYKLLIDLIKNKSVIDGVDLDIEEEVDIKDVIRLIEKIKKDLGEESIISMAPIQSALQTDTPGLGGFVYKDLYMEVGSFIDYFNVQCYNDYSISAYSEIIRNGYPENKIVMGSISSQDVRINCEVVKQLVNKYVNFGGVFNWEYFDSPPDDTNPGIWSVWMYDTMNNNL